VFIFDIKGRENHPTCIPWINYGTSMLKNCAEDLTNSQALKQSMQPLLDLQGVKRRVLYEFVVCLKIRLSPKSSVFFPTKMSISRKCGGLSRFDRSPSSRSEIGSQFFGARQQQVQQMQFQEHLRAVRDRRA